MLQDGGGCVLTETVHEHTREKSLRGMARRVSKMSTLWGRNTFLTIRCEASLPDRRAIFATEIAQPATRVYETSRKQGPPMCDGAQASPSPANIAPAATVEAQELTTERRRDGYAACIVRRTQTREPEQSSNMSTFV